LLSRFDLLSNTSSDSSEFIEESLRFEFALPNFPFDNPGLFGVIGDVSDSRDDDRRFGGGFKTGFPNPRSTVADFLSIRACAWLGIPGCRGDVPSGEVTEIERGIDNISKIMYAT
jgi:hypothetical protein